MIEPLLADAGVSISDLKRNPSAVIDAAHGQPIAVLNRNIATAYLVPAGAWEALLERLDDLELAEIVRARAAETPVEITLDAL